MPTSAHERSVRRFGVFEINLQSGELQKNGLKLRLSGQAFQVLAVLVENAGEVVSREDLHSRLWAADTFVDFDHGLNNAVARIREVLDDSSESPRYVETIPRRGYRFIATLNPIESAKARAQEAHAETAVPPDVRREGNLVSRHFRLVLWTVAVFVLALLALVLYRSRSARDVRQAPIRSLAVLPLKNLTGDPRQEYLADGMTEELIGRLASIRDLRVTSRTSVMRFKDTQLSVPEIAKALNVDAIVEGSILREDSRIRVHAQLIRAATDEHFWSESYDREFRDVLELESDVAETIAEKVEVTITGKERARLVAARDVAPEVYESYLRGLFSLNKETRTDLEESIQYFEQAIKIDPTFAPAYVGLAKAYSVLSTIMVGDPPSKFRPKVMDAARKALELDPQLVEAHVLLASVYQKQWQWKDAENEIKTALDLRPNDGASHSQFASFLLAKGQIDEALEWARRGRQLDPVAVPVTDVAWILFFARRYDDAEGELRAQLAVKPDQVVALWYLGFVLIADGRAGEAIPPLEKAVTISRGSPGVMGVLVRAYAKAGRRKEALKMLNKLKQKQRTGYVPAGALVQAYIGLGDNDQALEWLKRGYEERSAILQWLKVEPTFDPLRNDPRFVDLVRRVGL